MGIGLVSGQLCSKALPFIAPIVLCVLEFCGDSSYRDNKKHFEWMSLDWSTKTVLVLKSALIPVNIELDIIHRNVLVGLVEKRKYFWLILPVTLIHAHSNLRPWNFFLPTEIYQLQNLIKFVQYNSYIYSFICTYIQESYWFNYLYLSATYKFYLIRYNKSKFKTWFHHNLFIKIFLAYFVTHCKFIPDWIESIPYMILFTAQ